METAANHSAQPKVSVAMITYNHRPYIEKAVDSILKQETNFPFELLIGEDCSNDGTRELVLELEKRHPGKIRAITSERNVRAHANLRRTELACRGKYVAYCEGDDFWNDPQKLAKQVAFLEARPDYVMVHSHCHRYYVAENRLSPNSFKVAENLDDSKGYEDNLLGRRLMMTLTVLIRREALFRVIETCPECTDSKWPMGDTQRFLELSRLGKVGCIHEPLATKNMLDESASSSRDPRKLLRFVMAGRELMLHYLKKYPADKAVDRVVRQKSALAVLRHAYEAADSQVADAMFADYVAQGGDAVWCGRLLRWGSRTDRRRNVTAPLFKVESLWRKVERRLQMAMNA